jgi:phosphoglycolate phosphatase
MITVIVFDFDGVIVRSSEFLKREAWQVVLGSYGERAMSHFGDAEARYGEGRGGDRYDVLRYIFERLSKPTNQIPSLVEAAAGAFNAYLQKRISEVGVEPSDRKALQELSSRYPLYINSATPDKELKQTVTLLRLHASFKGVFGRPSSKSHNLRLALSREHAMPTNMLFVGDGEHDYKAALEVGCHFTGYTNEWNNWAARDNPFPLVTSIPDVLSYVTAMPSPILSQYDDLRLTR